MRRIPPALFLSPAAAPGQSLVGEWRFQGPAGVVRLSLSQEGTTLTGTMLGTDGTRFALEGNLDGVMEGREAEQGLLRFENGATYLDQNRVFVTTDNPHCR